MSAAGDPSTKRTRLDHDVRRRQLLQAAGELFLRRPYSDVSITDIAEAAGVARGLVHHYFESKRALYLEVVRLASQAAARAATPDGAPRPAEDDRWARVVDSYLAFVDENRALWCSAALRGGPEGDVELASILDDGREVIAEQTIVALGLVDADTPVLRALVRGFGGLVQEVTLEWVERGRLTREQARTVLVRALPLLLEDVLPALAPAARLRP